MKFKSEVQLEALNNATVDTDKFLVSDSSTVKYRTGTQLLSDLGIAGIYVPYTGATGNVDLGTHTLSSYNLIVNHTSGSGVAASITKGGSGEALTINKTSGSGNAMSVTGGLTSLVDLTLSSIPNATIDTDKFIVSDGGAIKYRTGAEVLSDIGAQAALTNPITGTGTLNFVSKFTATGSTLGDSQIFDNGTNVGIGTASPSAKLDIKAQGALSSDLTFVVKNSADTVKLIEANGAGGIDIRSTPGNRLTLSNTVETSFDITDTAGHSKRFFLRNSDKTLGIYNNDAGQQRTQLRLVTGAAASSDRLSLLEAGGNVGIGTTAPSTLLQVGNQNSSSDLVSLGVSYNTSRTTRGGIVWRDATNITGRIHTEYDGTTISMQFGSLYNSGYNANPLMTIRGNGNIGIGTTTPSQLLELVGLDNIYNQIRTSGANSTSGIVLVNDARNWVIRNNGLDGDKFQIRDVQANAQRLTIDTAGNVGIGTTAPAYALDVNGNINISSAQFLRYNGTTGIIGSATSITGGTSSQLGIRSATDILFSTGGSTEKMRITSAGNVGIGTTIPETRLQIEDITKVLTNNVAGVAQGTLSLVSTDAQATNVGASLVFGGNYINSSNTRIAYAAITGRKSNSSSGNADGYLSFLTWRSTGLTEAMRITSGGNVGIGTSSPDGTVPMTINANNNSYYSTLLLTNSNTGTGALSQLQFRTANQPLNPLVIHQFNDGGNAQITNVANSYLQLGTNNTVRLSITPGGAMGLGVLPTNTLGRFEASNDIVAYSSSDKRWKTNIKNIDSPLEKISQINGVEFDWIEDEPVHGNKGHDIGVIAQEIEQILPDAVQTRESGMKAVKYEKVIPLLIEAVKEQQKQIEELKQLLNGFTN